MEFETAPYTFASNYILVGDNIVPSEFIERLYAQLRPNCFDSKEVKNIQDYCNHEFWHSITLQEKEVIGPCILFLSDIYSHYDFINR